MAGITPSRAVMNTNPYEPTPGAIEILRALAVFHYMTVEQIVRRFYKPGTITTVQARMKELTEHRYCVRRPLPVPALIRGGAGAYVYSLGTKGRGFVESLGMEVPARFRPSETPQKNQLAHIVACTDVYVAATLLCRDREGLSLERLVHERTLRGMGERVLVNGKLRRVTPDGWLSVLGWREGTRFRFPIALEVDMGTERKAKWRDKIRGLLAWIDEPYPKLFGTRNVLVAVVSPAKPQHAAVLRTWTEAELAELKRPKDAKHFIFGGANPAVVTPEAFFLKPAWRKPFEPADIPLLEVDSE